MMQSYFTRILILTLFVTLAGCGSNNDVLTAEEIKVSELIKAKFEQQGTLAFGSDTLLASTETLKFYKDQNYNPIWTSLTELTPNGDTLFDLIANAYDYGLIPEMFHFSHIKKMRDSSLLDAEMLLTNAYFLMATHLQFGCVDSANHTYVWKKDSLSYAMEDELITIREKGNLKNTLLGHQPTFWDYQQLQKGLAAFLDSFALDTAHFVIPAFKEDSATCYAVTNQALIAHDFLDTSTFKNDSVFLERLRYFQLVNGLKDDAIVGKWTSRALAKSNKERFMQGALALEKWRWKKPYPERYIRVNIPEYALYFVDSSQLKRKHRVVVGAYGTQTPEFHASMRRMVTYPFWHVPYSISSTEILHKAKTDSAYFINRGYKIFKEGTQVDPKSVDWTAIKQNNFPYKVRQDGGGSNSLGKIKFLFPNIHSIYIHDTPSKRLFANDIRAYSHGCVRVHEPFELAKALVLADQHRIVPDTLDSLIARRTQRVIELEKPFEVYLEYITATGDSSGAIRFYPDVYGRDEKYLAKSFAKFDF